jgi:hypothetical protein
MEKKNYELPRGYKIVDEKINSSKKYFEASFTVRVPLKYNYLTRQDIECINDNCIKCEDCLIFIKNASGHIDVEAFDVSKKKINRKRLVEGIPQRFRIAIKKFKEFNNDRKSQN